MIDYSQALALILADAPVQPSETVALDRAHGRVTARAIVSTLAVPSFDNSAMDGFALAADDKILSAGLAVDVVGAQAAGDGLAAGTHGAFEIMTGARLPDGLDSVVPVEQVEILARSEDGRPRRIRLLADLTPGQHVRRVGQDIALGQTVFPVGTRLCANEIMVLAAIGAGQVEVRRAPRVAVIATGRELVDDPALPLAAGQIRNSNGPFLAAALPAAGAELVYRETVSDVPEQFIAAVERALAAGAELLISTGAVSMGRHDFVPAALATIGAEPRFHKVAIRPGKPLLYARLAGGQQFFGLPGNPVSSAVGLRFFVEPALRARLGWGAEQPLDVPLAALQRHKPGLQQFLKAVLGRDAEGQLRVQVLAGQESFRILPLAAANAWAVVPATSGDLAAGVRVAVYTLSHGSGYQVRETSNAG